MSCCGTRSGARKGSKRLEGAMSNGWGDRNHDEVIEVLGDAGCWRPAIGPEATGLLDAVGLPAASRATVLSEAGTILARCVDPRGDEDDNTGLVVGYVQSGKTLSFTTVAALAHDNG